MTDLTDYAEKRESIAENLSNIAAELSSELRKRDVADGVISASAQNCSRLAASSDDPVVRTALLQAKRHNLPLDKNHQIEIRKFDSFMASRSLSVRDRMALKASLAYAGMLR